MNMSDAVKLDVSKTCNAYRYLKNRAWKLDEGKTPWPINILFVTFLKCKNSRILWEEKKVLEIERYFFNKLIVYFSLIKLPCLMSKI